MDNSGLPHIFTEQTILMSFRMQYSLIFVISRETSFDDPVCWPQVIPVTGSDSPRHKERVCHLPYGQDSLGFTLSHWRPVSAEAASLSVLVGFYCCYEHHDQEQVQRKGFSSTYSS